MRKFISFVLMACMLLTLVACSNNGQLNNINKNTQNTQVDDPVPQPGPPPALENEDANIDVNKDAVSDKENTNIVDSEDDAWEMFKGTDYEKAFNMLGMLKASESNVMISPLSINTAINMASHAFVNDEYSAKMDEYYGKSLNERDTEYTSIDKDDGVLKLANSVWVRDELFQYKNDTFVNELETIYDAELKQFNDNSTPEINSWVSDKTNGMIPSIINEIPKELSSILINALYFNGKWAMPFDSDYQVVTDIPFENNKGEEEECEMMLGEDVTYMENDQATAFRKNYLDGYSFIGILPKDGMIDFETFDFEELLESETSKYDVSIGIPKFESEYTTSLVETLDKLGLRFIFSDGAINGVLNEDADIDLEVSDIIHKTAIKMTESGTEAAAVTAVMMTTCALTLEEPEAREVILNRPFVYTILDENDNIVFIGTVNSIG